MAPQSGSPKQLAIDFLDGMGRALISSDEVFTADEDAEIFVAAQGVGNVTARGGAAARVEPRKVDT